MSDLFLRSLLADNLALTWFLGLCTMLTAAPSIREALGMGAAVALVLAITMPVNRLVSSWLLVPDAWSWFPDLDLSFLAILAFLLILTATLQILDMALARFRPAWQREIGAYLPLIPIQSVLLAGSLFMMERRLSMPETIVSSLGHGLGWLLAIAAFAGIRERLRYHDMPAGLEGVASGFFIAGLLSMGFLALGRTVLP